MWAWGAGHYGQLGVGGLEPRLSPAAIDELHGKTITQVALGSVCVHVYMGMPMGIQCTVRCGVVRGPQRARACAQHAPSREDADSTDASARPAPANRGGNDVLVSVATQGRPGAV